MIAADRWRRTDPARYARYISALETLHADVMAAAEQWLGVEAQIGGMGQLVVRSRGREVSAPLHPDSFGSPSALRRQIVALAARLHERPVARKRPSGRR